jgi:hypothetical protein
MKLEDASVWLLRSGTGSIFPVGGLSLQMGFPKNLMFYISGCWIDFNYFNVQQNLKLARCPQSPTAYSSL